MTVRIPIPRHALAGRCGIVAAVADPASSEGIVIVDTQHRVVSVNRAFCRSTQFAYLEVVGGGLGCVDDGHGNDAFLTTCGRWSTPVEPGRAR